ncbi:PMT_2 domain-containing protein [Desulfovibrionales bacterium]
MSSAGSQHSVMLTSPVSPPAAVTRAGVRVTCQAVMDPICLVILALAAFLLFFQVGVRPFWQDEAETACLSRNVLKYSLPLAFDGVNLVSQEEQREFSTNFIWSWSPWVQIYVASAGFLMGGENTTAGRSPFVFVGLLCVYFVYRLIRVHFNSLAWARLSAMLLSVHVPFLLFARQLRYFTLGMCLALLAVNACLVRPQTIRTRLVSAVAFALMFHSNYLLFMSFLPSLLITELLLSRRLPKWNKLILPFFVVLAIILPGIAFYGIGKQGGMLDFTTIPSNIESYFSGLFYFMIPLPIGVWLLFRWRSFFVGRFSIPHDSGERFTLYLVCIIILNIFAMAIVPQCFHRYIVHLYPFCAIILGWVVLKIWSFHRISGLLLGALLLLTNWMHVVPMQLLGIASVPPQTDFTMLNYPNIPLKLFFIETVKGYPDVNQNLIEFFNNNAKPGETVLITYGDLPLQFYTRCKVIGGLQDLVPKAGEFPDWVVKRNTSRTNRDNVLVSSDEFVLNELDLSRYEVIELPHADEMFGAREDPYYHRFIPMAEPVQKLVVYKFKKGG